MANTQQARLAGLTAFLPTVAKTDARVYEKVYEQNRHRVYALAFWMTDNELAAEELMRNVFCRVFAASAEMTAEAVDRALVIELREMAPLGPLTLECDTCEEVLNVRRNVLRCHLERAVVQLPWTERLIYLLHDGEGYDHRRVGRMLGLTVEESQYGLHQARTRLRQLLARMQN
jgi:RNA polymerase sigma-70 factor (ECF subfamily)